MPYSPETKILVEIRERVIKIETIVSRLDAIEKTANEAHRIANASRASTSSAHKRLDKVDKSIFWFTTTLIGSILLGLLNLLINGGN